MRRAHLIVGLLGVLAFLITGQVMRHHNPKMQFLSPEVHMMYVSRHIYLLGAALVNMVLGLYFPLRPPGWRRALEQLGSFLILLSPLLLLLSFASEPELGLAGRGWRSHLGLYLLFGGVMTQFLSSIATAPAADPN